MGALRGLAGHRTTHQSREALDLRRLVDGLEEQQVNASEFVVPPARLPNSNVGAPSVGVGGEVQSGLR